MEFLWKTWWFPSLIKPSKSGLLTNCSKQSNFESQFLLIKTLLNYIFYNEDGDVSVYSATIRKFIKEKQYILYYSIRELMNEYFNKLLSKDLPSLEIDKTEKKPVSITSICLSLECIKLIQCIFEKRIDEVKSINKNCANLIERISLFTKDEDNGMVNTNIYKPNPKLFTYILPDDSNKMTLSEFTNALHYVVFSRIEIAKLKDVNIKLEEWQRSFVELLLEIYLSSYSNESDTENKGVFLDLFYQILKTPFRFVSDPQKEDKIKLIGYYLRQHYKNLSEEDIFNEINDLAKVFQDNIGVLLKQQQQIDYILREIINALKMTITRIENDIKKVKIGMYQCAIGEKFIELYYCDYKINKILGKKHKGEPKFIPYKYTINLKIQTINNRKPLKNRPKQLHEY